MLDSEGHLVAPGGLRFRYFPRSGKFGKHFVCMVGAASELLPHGFTLQMWALPHEF